ncbi:MAG: hypothetical protein VST68_00725 [Nitrospirota bacterium]|nr:hypothetical protein [Nitrospirota bacterium]
MVKKACPREGGGSVISPAQSQERQDSCSSGKAAANLTRVEYSQYVNTAIWQECPWRLFSTFPFSLYTYFGEDG